jgi:hypothetical protein
MAVLVFPVSNVGQACGKFGPIGIFQQGYFDLRLRQSLMAMRNKGVLRFIKVVFQGLNNHHESFYGWSLVCHASLRAADVADVGQA